MDINSNADLNGSAGDQTGFLLQRLQELKAWQQEQEDRLLREQEDQMEQLYLETNEANANVNYILRQNLLHKPEKPNVRCDDDDTIDQDISSIVSFDAQSSSNVVTAVPNGDTPDWAQNSQSTGSMEAIRLSKVESLKPNFDELPINSKPKTFEELLNEQLSTNKEAVATPEQTTPKDSRPTSSSKPFLRRGSGLARYGGVNGKPNGVIKRIHSSGKLQTRNFASSTGNVSKPRTPVDAGKRVKSSASCSKLSALGKESPKELSKEPKKPKKPVLKPISGLNAYDSVELSFMGKLASANQNHKREMEDLATFEMLEEAACDSSFCSSSSTVKKLVENVNEMPSPIPKSHTSTPKVALKSRSANLICPPEKLDFDEPETSSGLIKDIQDFLTSKGATVVKGNHAVEGNSDDDDTLQNLDIDNVNSDEGDWSDIENDQPNNEVRRSGNKNVRFKESEPEMSFSPPKVPKNSASYLIWSIFTKEREEREKRKLEKLKDEVKDAKIIPSSDRGLNGFEETLLNAKLAELEKEIAHFKKENANLTSGRRKLNTDRKQLAKDIEEFEKTRDLEKKKLEEERKRIRREKALFEKSQKDKKSTYGRKAQEEIEELQSKVNKLTDELERKECKWSNALNKLQDQVKFLERENQQLHEENHKIKVKNIPSKVSTRLIDPAKKMVGNTALPQKESDDLAVTESAGDIIENSPSVKEKLVTPRMNFSPADSLESNITLVSGGITTSEATTNKVTTETTETAAKTYAIPKIQSVRRDEVKGTTEKVYVDGRSEICYPNGNRKEISADGKMVKVLYYNGDVKESLPSGLVKYYYSQTKTWHLTYPDGKEVLQFNNGQEEVRYPNGSLQISFADGSIKKIAVDGSENVLFPDGTQCLVKPNGDRTLLLANGQKEIHTSDFKRREYPDGTVKILYEDGRQETRYSSGRVRIKDKDGNLLHDSSSHGKTLPPKRL